MENRTGYRKEFAISELLFVLMVLANILGGCAETGGRITTPADFTGFITRIETSGTTGVGVIYAESHADKLVHRFVIKVTGNTLIYRLDGGNYQSIDISMLLVQDQVQVWFSGKARESKPGRGKARQVVVINHY